MAGAQDAIARKVPACPEWTIKDVIAHLAGLAADWRAGNLAGYSGDASTARQVAERRDRSIDDLLAEWADQLSGPRFRIVPPDGRWARSRAGGVA